MSTKTKVKIAIGIVWLSGFGWGFMTGGAFAAHADPRLPMVCDPLVPTYDAKMCWGSMSLQNPAWPYAPAPQAPGPAYTPYQPTHQPFGS